VPQRKIIIDTDPGQDDAVAILLALASPEIEVLGITAVAGNVPLNLTKKKRTDSLRVSTKN
jgi:purine nucleosidase